MNSRDVAFVGIRLLAVYFALKLVFSLASAGGFYWIFFVEGGSVPGAGDSRIMAWTGLLGSVLYVVVAVALWFGTSTGTAITRLMSCCPFRAFHLFSFAPGGVSEASDPVIWAKRP